MRRKMFCWCLLLFALFLRISSTPWCFGCGMGYRRRLDVDFFNETVEITSYESDDGTYIELELFAGGIAYDYGTELLPYGIIPAQMNWWSQPGPGRYLGSLQMFSSWYQSVYVEDSYAYYAASYSGFYVVDVSHPGSPWILSEVNTTNAHGVTKKGRFAYVGDACGGLLVIDVFDPLHPFLVHTRSDGCYEVLTLDGDLLYAAFGYEGMKIFDVSVFPPIELSHYMVPYLGCTDITIYHPTEDTNEAVYAFCGSESGFDIIDVSDPLNPTFVVHENTFHAHGIDFKDETAFIADKYAGLRIYDISNINQPVQISWMPSLAVAYDVKIGGNYAFVTTHANDGGIFGIRVINITNPHEPELFDLIHYKGSSHRLFLKGNYLYGADWDFGLRVYTFGDIQVFGSVIPGTRCHELFNVLVIATDGSGSVEHPIEVDFDQCLENTLACYDERCFEGRCVSEYLCGCRSAWDNINCTRRADQCYESGGVKHVDKLKTQWVPILLESTRIENDRFFINFRSPVIEERYDYRILIGEDVEGTLCDSWTGLCNGWIQQTEGCNVTNSGNLPWNDLENRCGWNTTLSNEESSIYTNTIHFRVREDLEIIQRDIEWDYRIEITIPKNVLVTVTRIEVYSPIDVDTFVSGQNAHPNGLTGAIDLLTLVGFPFNLTFDTVTEQPDGVYSEVFLEYMNCSKAQVIQNDDNDDNDDNENDDDQVIVIPPEDQEKCVQSWSNKYRYDEGRCDVTGQYIYRYRLTCREGIPEAQCPYSDDEPAFVYISTYVVSENFCVFMQVETDISLTLETSASMQSFEDEELAHLETGFVTSETAYFRVTVISEELDLHESEVISVWLKEKGGAGRTVNLYVERVMTTEGDNSNFDVQLGVPNYPVFSFQLGVVGTGYFEVYAKVRVTYAFEATGRRRSGNGAVEERTYRSTAYRGIFVTPAEVNEMEEVNAGSKMSWWCSYANLFLVFCVCFVFFF